MVLDRETIRTDLTYGKIVRQSQDVEHTPTSLKGRQTCSIKITRLLKSETLGERKEKSLNMEAFGPRLMWRPFVGL